MTDYFTADPHFDHENLRRKIRQRFADKEQMNGTILESINKVCLPNDTLYLLGDFAWRDVAGFRAQINCRVVLVRGNHDPTVTACRRIFDEAHNLVMGRRFNGKSVTLCHYPMESWYGQWHFHGHRHGRPSSRGAMQHRRDVGWDCWGRPVTFREAISGPCS